MTNNKEPVKATGMILLPPAKNRCQTCAADHQPHEPHNAHSLFYAVKFRMEHGRDPNWIDAMAHCSVELKAAWTLEMAKMGIDVMAGHLYPPKEDKTR